MSLSPSQQTREHIDRAKHILVVTRQHPTIDSIASAMALGVFFKDKKKNADIVVPGIEAKDIPGFLAEGSDMLKPNIGAMRTLEITLDVSQTPVDEFLYDVRDGKLEITVVPKHNGWNTEDLSFKNGEYRYDLIITLGATDAQSLGTIANEYADFLHRTTLINIDTSTANEHWGQINLVDLNAVSISEILFNLFMEMDAHAICESIATALLTGMIAKTKGFRTPNVTTQSLHVSSQLMNIGARRADIVNGLWRSRSIQTLKLWGKALSRIQFEKDHALAWATLSHQDFIEAGAGAEHLPDVIDELISYAPEAKVVVLFYEHETERDAVCVVIATSPPHHATNLGREFGAKGSHERSFVIFKNTKLIEVEKSTIDILKKTIKPI